MKNRLRRILGTMIVCSTALMLIALIWFWPTQLATPIGNAAVGFQSGAVAERTAFGFWNVRAPSSLAAFEALGFVFAADRLFQFDLARRLSAGRLAEILGDVALEADLFNRSFDYLGLALQDSGNGGWLNEPEHAQLKQELQLFLQGVNTYVSLIENKFWYWPPEYRILRSTPTHFDLQDVFLAMSTMQLYFNSAKKTDLSNTYLLQQLAPHAELFFAGSNDIFASLESYLKQGLSMPPDRTLGKNFGQRNFSRTGAIDPLLVQKWMHAMTDQKFVQRSESLTEMLGHAESLGSNAWTCSGKRMKSTFATLANDPHLGLGLPSFLNFARVETPENLYFGAFIPLAPYPVIGMSRHGAWGMTFSELDQADYYQTEIDTAQLETAKSQLYEGEWIPLEKREEIIRVHGTLGAKEIKASYAQTRFGPILREKPENIALQTRERTANSIQSSDSAHARVLLAADVSLKPGNRHLASIRGLALAHNKAEFKATLRGNRAPPQNVFWADKTGAIAWGVTGAFPVRNWSFDDALASNLPQYNEAARLDFEKKNLRISQVPGSLVLPLEERFLWSDVLPAVDSLYSEEFKEDCVGNANEQLSTDLTSSTARAALASFDWALPARSERLQTLLAQKSLFEESDFQNMQTDLQDGFAAILIKTLQSNPLFAENLNPVSQRLNAWDFFAQADSKAELAFERLMYVWKQIVWSRLGIVNENFIKMRDKHSSGTLLAWARMLADKSHPWHIHASEKNREILGASLKQAMENLIKDYAALGLSWENSTWGDVHQFGPEHALAGVPVLGNWFRYRKIPAGGTTHSLKVQGYSRTYGSSDYRVKHGAGLRFVATPATGEASVMFPSGASGVPGTTQFEAHQENYLAGRYYKLSLAKPDP